MKSRQGKHKRDDAGARQTNTQTESEADKIVELLDSMTCGDLNQPCSKKIRADLDEPKLVGAQGTEVSLTIEGFQRGESFGFEHETGGGTRA